MSKRVPVARYQVRATFRAPLEFAYRWCTDYTSKDSRYSGEGYRRRILRRSTRSVVLEDLYDTGTGWIWLRRVIRLDPPNGWHAESVGSDRAISVDYRLSKLPGDRTLLTIRARRRPDGVGIRNPAKSAWERSVAANWARFGRALEREYARGRPRRDPN
ncbi:MAG: hypothetical protein L3K01_01435 [Thermoplasmata archaeon]|nr:hypothetical protein [Thermoplasmata archaeon]